MGRYGWGQERLRAEMKWRRGAASGIQTVMGDGGGDTVEPQVNVGGASNKGGGRTARIQAEIGKDSRQQPRSVSEFWRGRL